MYMTRLYDELTYFQPIHHIKNNNVTNMNMVKLNTLKRMVLIVKFSVISTLNEVACYLI